MADAAHVAVCLVTEHGGRSLPASLQRAIDLVAATPFLNGEDRHGAVGSTPVAPRALLLADAGLRELFRAGEYVFLSAEGREVLQQPALFAVPGRLTLTVAEENGRSSWFGLVGSLVCFSLFSFLCVLIMSKRKHVLLNI